MDKNHPEKKPKEKPLSLYPLTMDEALKRALETPPPKDGSQTKKKSKSE